MRLIILPEEQKCSHAEQNRVLLKGKCGECEYREACGGCRGRAYAYSGDYLAEDPVCLRDLMTEENVYPANMKCFGWCVG